MSEHGNNRNDVMVMRDKVMFDGKRSRSRFWILLILSSIIAAAGVVADSTATVIGAMIVAPMLVPIQGMVLATVLGERGNLVRSSFYVVAGATTAIAIGWGVGFLTVDDVVAATNTQVAGRVHPGLIDLLAALATGVVGAIALIRKDIADTLPGVAIAISLVPPLSVAGLTFESGAPLEALGALLLFLTNVTAILATGIIVMAFYGVHEMPAISGKTEGAPVSQRRAIVVILVMMIVTGAPLTWSTIQTSNDTLRQNKITQSVTEWTEDVGWQLLSVEIATAKTTIQVTGPEPRPNTDDLRKALSDDGISLDSVVIELIPSYRVNLDEDNDDDDTGDSK